MKHHPINPSEMFLCIWRHRDLLRQLTLREVSARYKGSYLGAAWAIVTPLVMLFVYTFFFGFVLKARWGVETSGAAGFSITLFSGLIVFNLFGEIATRAHALIISNANFVTRVVFPLEVLPWATALGAVFHFLISLIILLLAHAITVGFIPWTSLLLPMIIVPFLLMLMGLAWFLAATGVFLRDIGQMIGSVQMALLFLSPVFYPAETLGANMQFWIYLNPLTFPIETSRQLLLWNQIPDWLSLVTYWFICLLTAWAGFVWFQKTRKGFADVL